jgi:hypothetical protein
LDLPDFKHQNIDIHFVDGQSRDQVNWNCIFLLFSAFVLSDVFFPSFLHRIFFNIIGIFQKLFLPSGAVAIFI